MRAWRGRALNAGGLALIGWQPVSVRLIRTMSPGARALSPSPRVLSRAICVLLRTAEVLSRSVYVLSRRVDVLSPLLTSSSALVTTLSAPVPTLSARVTTLPRAVTTLSGTVTTLSHDQATRVIGRAMAANVLTTGITGLGRGARMVPAVRAFGRRASAAAPADGPSVAGDDANALF